MAWTFNTPTDQLTGNGWSGTDVTFGLWWKQNANTGTSADPWGIYPNAGGGGAIRALLGTEADGVTMRLFDSSFAFLAAGAPGVGVWYCTYAVMAGTQWTVYHGTNPASLTVVGPATRVAFTNPGSYLLSLAVEYFDGDMAAIKIWNAALTGSEIALEAANYDAIRKADFEQGFTGTRSAPYVPDIGPAADLTALTTGGTDVDIAYGPPILDRPPSKLARGALPNRKLIVRRGRIVTPVRAPQNTGTQALPPQYFRTSRAHQRLRRTDRGGFYRYPVLQTAPQPTPTEPPDSSGGSFSPSWRRRVYKKRRPPLLSSIAPI
jgi:hypothetical protein